MGIVVVFWVFLFVVLMVYFVAMRRELEYLWRKKRMRYQDPVLELMRRYEVGDITREQFHDLLKAEMQRHSAEQRPRAG